MTNTSEILSNTFNQETECLNRLFTRKIRSAAYTDSMNIEFMSDMPFYMTKIVDNYCYDCCYIIVLNKYLIRWRVYINNTTELISYIDVMRHKILQCKTIINNKFEFIGDEKYWYLCGCSELDKQIEEDAEYQKYVETNEIDEDFEQQHKERMSWRTDFYKELYNLDQHLYYFKNIPHKSYRDNILFELMTATNSDCVNNIIKYL